MWLILIDLHKILNKSKGEYNVWKTDYDNYALVYVCKLRSVLDYIYTIEHAWILSRTRTLDKNSVNDLKKTLNE